MRRPHSVHLHPETVENDIIVAVTSSVLFNLKTVWKDYDQWQFMIRGEIVAGSESDHSSDGTPSNSCQSDENGHIYDSLGITCNYEE